MSNDKLIQAAENCCHQYETCSGIVLYESMRELRAALAEAKPAEQQGEQEPVEYQLLVLGKRWTHCSKEFYEAANGAPTARALYTHPQRVKAEPLTEEWIDTKAQQNGWTANKAPEWLVEIIKDVEAAHGIGVQQEVE